ncbi:CHY zinc finger protein [Salipaludibacillus sp. CF4.18]|uniref:CHY zinc finger protein n=1 Tax=Salipaludibacillus sp. CF4.18 TaxID=3373081 RepID=UPI003EE7B609
MWIHGVEVMGKVKDKETRCVHYHSELDRVAMKFYCCNMYYSCIHCHIESTDHPVSRWPLEEFDEKAVLCGACGAELTIHDYIDGGASCPTCQAAFNPGCERHHHLYFSVNKRK